MGARGIVERANNVDERVGVLVRDDIHQRLRSCASGRGSQIRELDRRRYALPRVVHLGEAIQPPVGHFRNANRGFAPSVRRARDVLGAGHELKERGLAA
jgi:hypothetical protein